MTNFPVIKLEVDRMQHSIMVAINSALDAEKQNIEAEVKRVIEAFDFATLVRGECHRALGENLTNAIRNSIRTSFGHPDVARALDEFAAENVKNYLRELTKLYQKL